LSELETDVLLVSFEPAARVGSVTAEWDMGWPVMVDEDQRVYRAYGLDRASAARIWLSPATIWFYLRQAARGRFLRLSGADTRQLGGDFIIDSEGQLQFSHRSREPADRLQVERLLGVLTRLQ